MRAISQLPTGVQPYRSPVDKESVRLPPGRFAISRVRRRCHAIAGDEEGDLVRYCSITVSEWDKARYDLVPYRTLLLYSMV
ncbi:hypothetical protein F7734_10425 [Scytonema sp. UIC 10036]|uniref:hypothetical protein n=1 Tax=Scytonema sp. UIC 10036 TaxID=2304196 RepID=UPI0012DAB764|nr:hypothetical protein [Scytonema sp. UIC 10036]MUG92841.1 hypothetical protein [Scytonema sp. UIC 10036]